ncbi:MAG: bifunctional precorrin-2 dehydrogenase/sirohydrochlorin ferrochelatase [Acidobacteriales bacterium]|nr:bifunctional precorrin-2 dehydrogenase/sirohydrochlorin ferrochelatase [Terriglobales bacterium]
MKLYPLMLNLEGKAVVIVGGGEVATRKAQHLLETGAIVTVISPHITPALKVLVSDGRVRWLNQDYDAAALTRCRPALVFAATDLSRINAQIAADAHGLRAWVNVLDNSAVSDFQNVAVVEQTPITLAISTNGTSPALLRLLKSRLQTWLDDGYAALAQWLGELRPRAEATLPDQSQRQQLYETILQSDVLDLLHAGDTETARTHFDSIVSEVL